MGQLYTYCSPTEEYDKRIDQLEGLLQEQEREKEDIKKKMQKEKDRQRKYRKKMRGRDDQTRIKEKIEQLSNEKKQVFKTMMKERKNVSKLEDEIEEYKKQLREYENQLKSLTYERDKAQSRASEVTRSLSTERPRGRPSITSAKSEPTTPSKRGSNLFGMKSVLEGITIPRVHIPGVGTPDSGTKPLPFRVKTPKEDDVFDGGTESVLSENDVGSQSSDSSFDDEESKEISVADTIVLDSGYDTESEATHVYSWLHGQSGAKSKRDIKQLKHRLASLLTSRSEGYRQTLIESYRDQYNKNLEKDIKQSLRKGHAMEMVHGLLMTRAQFDAELIFECVARWDIEPVAEIICCRTVPQLKQLDEAYKKKYKLNVKKQLQALAQKDKKKTLVKMLGSILDYKRVEKADVDVNDVNQDLNFVLTQRNFKKENKEKLVLIFCANSVEYITVLNDQFLLKSKDSLAGFIDKKLGPKSTAGFFCKQRIGYAFNAPGFYATKIKSLGKHFKKHRREISNIFIQRMELDLDLIQRAFKAKKYGDGKDLKEWILSKTSGSKSGYFLTKMLDNCARYTQFHRKEPGSTPATSKAMKVFSGAY